MKNAVVYASNDNYAKILGISMLSLLKNNPATEFDLYIFADHISWENQKKLQNVVDGENERKDPNHLKHDLFFVDIEEKLKVLEEHGATSYGAVRGVNSIVAFGRFCVDEILPEEVERVLYLDCDTMVRGDISRLFLTEMGGHAIGMCVDCIRNSYKHVIDFPLECHYHNSGVMLIDIFAWKAHGCREKALRHMASLTKPYPLPDQDTINKSLQEHIVTLPSCYNLLPQMLLYPYRGFRQVYRLEAAYWIDRATWQEAVTDPVIVHFAGNTFIRPWYANSKHPLHKEYDAYYAQSPWGDEPREVYVLDDARRVQYFLYRYTPSWVNILASSLMHHMFMKKCYKVE